MLDWGDYTMECIFCRIVKGEIPSEKVYEDDDVLAFKDVNPEAPCHVLLIPKTHAQDLIEAGSELFSVVASKVPMLAEKLGLKEKGFRVVVNTGGDGGQTVGHLHFHILGGRSLEWPPG